MPKAGGTYFYVKRAMGPAVGTVDGLITWFSLSLKTAFALVGLAAFVEVIGGDIFNINIQVVAVFLCVVFVVINLFDPANTNGLPAWAAWFSLFGAAVFSLYLLWLKLRAHEVVS